MKRCKSMSNADGRSAIAHAFPDCRAIDFTQVAITQRMSAPCLGPKRASAELVAHPVITEGFPQSWFPAQRFAVRGVN